MRGLLLLFLLALAPASGLRKASSPPAARVRRRLGTVVGALLVASSALGPWGPGTAVGAAEAPQARTGVSRRARLEKEAAKPVPDVLPFTGELRGFGKPAATSEVERARRRIMALKPYLDEIERYVYTEDFPPIRAFLNVFSEQEESFVRTIDSVAAEQSPVAVATAEAMEHEAKEIFLALDDLRKAATLKKPVSCKKGYIKLALAYDRYLKASDSLPVGYDKIAPIEEFYATIPDAWLSYDRAPPEVRDAVLFIAGPDKGRTGVLLGYKTANKPDEAAAAAAESKKKETKETKDVVRTAVVKMDSNQEAPRLSTGELPYTEVKEVPTTYVARQLDPPDD